MTKKSEFQRHVKEGRVGLRTIQGLKNEYSLSDTSILKALNCAEKYEEELMNILEVHRNYGLSLDAIDRICVLRQDEEVKASGISDSKLEDLATLIFNASPVQKNDYQAMKAVVLRLPFTKTIKDMAVYLREKPQSLDEYIDAIDGIDDLLMQRSAM